MTTPQPFRRILVVGGANGIGGAIVDRLVDEGDRVACADVDLEAARARSQRRSSGAGTAVPVPMDVTDPRSVQTAVATAVEALDGLDGVVYAAGVTTTAPACELTVEQWRRVLAVNLDGAFLVACEAVSQLTAGAAVVFVGSQLATAAVPDKAAYIASKGGLEALTRALAVEWAPRGVRVVCLAPGPVRAGMLLERLGGDPSALRQVEAQVPLGRLGEPEEIAGAVRFLLGPDAGFITGVTVVADGGYLAR